MTKNYIDLFSGIGGFAYAAHMAGFKCDNHFFSEIDPYAIKLYQLRFPDAINLGSIIDIDFEKLKKEYPGEWVVTGGFPCPDISIAGKGKGLFNEDGTITRSGLWFEMWRAIRILRPKYVIAENVSAITFRGLDRVISSLTEIGYAAEWQDIRASDVGAPHRRERIWIVAHPCCLERNARSKEPRIIRKMQNNRTEHDNSSGSSETRKISDANSNRPQGKWSESNSKGSVRLCNREAKGNTEIWAVEPSVCRVVNGLSSELDGYQGRLAVKSHERVNRLKGLGNSIIPQIAKIIFQLCEANF